MDTPTNPEPNDNAPPPEPFDRRDERQRRREERRAARFGRGGGGWIGGLVLILLGVVFLFQNAGLPFIQNWWAFFILIPALGAFGAAWRNYQEAGGRVTASARGSLIGGLVLTLVAAIFLFDLNWGLFGPALLILAGVGLLLNALLAR